jgi:heme/copper-type cytochrome/quinol oxidase subunit 2
MGSNVAKVAVVVAALAVAVVLFVVLGGGDDSDEAEPAAETITRAENGGEKEKSEPRGKGVEPATEQVPRITIVQGQPAGGVQELEFTVGEEVRFEVESDIAEHVHVHGYDVMQDVEPGKTVVVSFPADIEGVFEVELEDAHVQIAELTVNPD